MHTSIQRTDPYHFPDKGKLKGTLTGFLLAMISICGFGQAVPAMEENIPYLVTFGADSDTSWGDDDFCQVFFIRIPESQTEPIYIRVFDPDTGGELDEPKGEFDTKVRFSVYGGKGCYSEMDPAGADPESNFESGIMLASRSFGTSNRFDTDWYSFGPLNPLEGEYVEKFDGRIFKIVAQGESGDDGNLYRYFLSTDSRENEEVEGANLFTFEYTFRLSNNQNNVSQIYPYMDDRTISVKISNFDWDDDGFIRIVSVAKNGELCPISNENDWARKEFPIIEEERNTSMEIQFIKNRQKQVKNNNVVVTVQNQYGENLPFYVIPIGGIPVYNPRIRMRVIER
jgi:hypothetical protein